MALHADSRFRLRLAKARQHMIEALGILDQLDAPGEIGATLDLAIERLATRMAARSEAIAPMAPRSPE